MVGTTISHYRITEKLGEGGMGVVYKAEDTSLDRPVALKFLAPHLVSDEEIRKRFEREAKAAAALNHPNVCTVHEIAEANGRTFIAMAFLEGEPLEKKIEAGPLKLKDALDIAIQTARGLEAAHEKGIVHRDIKPANLMITGSGSKQLVTIMDFGLALLTDRSKLTRTDETIGTVTYMSPEQTYGADVDHRSDVWSLGVVLYEMVTGQQPFKGHYDKAVMYSITNEEPEPMTALRTGVPMELEWIVGKCLAKEADKRYRSTADMVVDVETLSEKLKSGKSTIVRTGAPAGTGTPAGPNVEPTSQPADAEAQHSAPDVAPQAPATSVTPGSTFGPYRIIEDLGSGGESAAYRAEDTQLRRSVTISVLPESAARRAEQRQRLKVIGTAVFFVLAVVLILLSWTRQPAPSESASLRRFALTPEDFRGEAVISPNGKHIAYLAGTDQPTIWVRDLDREEPRELPGTAGARNFGLFWSPDSQFIGFAAGNELKKILLQGGPAITLCPLPAGGFWGGSWSPDGNVIAFSTALLPQIYEVRAQGGDPKLLFEPEQSEKALGNLRPWFLPGKATARGIVFTRGGLLTDTDIVFKNLETGEFSVLAEGGYPVFSPTGHIVYQRDVTRGGVWALPFSIEKLKPTGEPFPIVENVALPSVAIDGTLVSVDALGSAQQQLVWLDRTGRKLGTIGQPQQRIQNPALSPDGGRVVVSGIEEGANQDIWVHEVDRALKTRLTFDPGRDLIPKWSRSGEEVVFSSGRAGNLDIFSRAADGSGEPASLVSTPRPEFPSDWSPDMKYFLYVAQYPETGLDIWYLERKEQGGGFDSQPFLQTSFSEFLSRLSPDGRFVAYLSDESGRLEVYVRPFPQGGGKWQVSANGGNFHRWSKDGRELFYVEGETLMSVAVSTTDGFSAGSAKPLFARPGLAVGASSTFDVSPDGQRFVVVEDVESEEGKEAKPPSIHVVENWFEEFKDRAQD